MKNIHLIPTYKPSRLVKIKDNLFYTTTENIPSAIYQHIYITSDEEIKEGDYSFYLPFGVGKNIVIDGELCFHIEAKDGKGSFTQRTYQTLDRNKKIILTTDQSLDGVQVIDDEFLEWFVKNPSCEEVEVVKDRVFRLDEFNQREFYNQYKIIIPKEEPKQVWEQIIEICGGKEEFMKLAGLLPKQQTLEEAAEKYCLINNIPIDQMIVKTDRSCEFEIPITMFIAGAKWMQERMYSEEEVLETIRQYALEEHLITSSKPDIWFEQFKKK